MYHWVDGGTVRGTLQLGQPAWIAEATGVPVVSDLRSRDVAAGGQGAPLVSIMDMLWLRGRPGVPVALNLGGIANITVVHGEPVAFDTGPANALIDAVVADLTGQPFDADGVMAARGQVHDELLERLLADPYYARPAPKSTGKELFNLAYVARAMEGLPVIPAADLVATVTTLTARTVADAVRRYGGTEVVASGGGIQNPVLMHLLADELEIPVRTTDELGVPSAAKEAYAFAVLGFLTVHGLGGTVPSCTGAAHTSVLGSVTPGPSGLPTTTGEARPPARLLVE
jgi:anhydro-N-acetylmuramic acid kinase